MQSRAIAAAPAQCATVGVWFESVAQLVEHRPFKALVLGSSPSALTIQPNPIQIHPPPARICCLVPAKPRSPHLSLYNWDDTASVPVHSEVEGWHCRELSIGRLLGPYSRCHHLPLARIHEEQPKDMHRRSACNRRSHDRRIGLLIDGHSSCASQCAEGRCGG